MEGVPHELRRGCLESAYFFARRPPLMADVTFHNVPTMLFAPSAVVAEPCAFSEPKVDSRSISDLLRLDKYASWVLHPSFIQPLL